MSERFRSVRFLGTYLIVVAIYEGAAALAVHSDLVSISLMLRVGVMWLPGVGEAGYYALVAAEVLSTALLFALGMLFRSGKRPLRTYIATEVLLVIPTFFLAANLLIHGGGHVLVTEDGWRMIAVSLLASIAPVIIAIRILARDHRFVVASNVQ